MSLRAKKAKGKLKEKWEKELYREYKNLVDVKQRARTPEDKQAQAEKDFMKRWASGQLTEEEIEAFSRKE
jgi:hypothetical protein